MTPSAVPNPYPVTQPLLAKITLNSSEKLWLSKSEIWLCLASPYGLRRKRNFEFHPCVDGSVIEVLVNRQTTHTRRYYYSGKKPHNLCMHWTGIMSNIASLPAWQLSPISSNRLTT